MIERNSPGTPFFFELVEQLRHVKLDALPQIVAIIRDNKVPGAAPVRGRKGASSEGSAHSPDHLAQLVLEMSAEGSKLDLIQRAVVKHAMASTRGNVSAAARLLGIDRKALERKLARYGRGESDDD